MLAEVDIRTGSAKYKVSKSQVPGGTTSCRGPAPFRAPPPLGTAYSCAVWSRTAHRFRLLGGRAEAARATREPAGRSAACEGPRGGEGRRGDFRGTGTGVADSLEST